MQKKPSDWRQKRGLELGKYQEGAVIDFQGDAKDVCQGPGPDVSVDVTPVPCCSCCQNPIETEGSLQKYFFLFENNNNTSASIPRE